MKVKDLLVILSSVDPEADVLIERALDDELPSSMTFRLKHVTPAFANEIELRHQSFDISYYINPGQGSLPVVILADGEYPPVQQVRVEYYDDGPNQFAKYEAASAKPAKAQELTGRAKLLAEIINRALKGRAG